MYLGTILQYSSTALSCRHALSRKAAHKRPLSTAVLTHFCKCPKHHTRALSLGTHRIRSFHKLRVYCLLRGSVAGASASPPAASPSLRSATAAPPAALLHRSWNSNDLWLPTSPRRQAPANTLIHLLSNECCSTFKRLCVFDTDWESGGATGCTWACVCCRHHQSVNT